MEQWVILTFPSTHQAMAAEDALRRAGFRIQVIPAPPRRSRACGLAVKIAGVDAARACALLTLESVAFDRPAGRP